MNKLIYDIGLHTGEDTDFYLKKGFDVVAVEANPMLLEAAEKRFKHELENGSLRIIPKAIATNHEGVKFAINSRQSEWGTIDPDYARRNELVGSENEWIQVPSATLESIVEECGTPYYMKIDIEGADKYCVDSLLNTLEKPKFLSVEITFFSTEDYFDLVAKLWCMGYRKFKIVNQGLVREQKCPNPPLEGKYVDYSFGKGSSGMFGEEAPGEWQDIETTMRLLMKIGNLIQKHSPLSGRFRKTLFSHYYRKFCAKVLRNPIAWFDLHATN